MARKNVHIHIIRTRSNVYKSPAKTDLLCRNAHYPPHTHSGLTTHLILKGEFVVTYPDDTNPTKETFGPGARIDVDADRRHEVWMGKEGCTYVIGE